MTGKKYNVIMTILELLMRLVTALSIAGVAVCGFSATSTLDGVEYIMKPQYIVWNIAYTAVIVTICFFARRYLNTHPKLMVVLHFAAVLSVLVFAKGSMENIAVVFVIAAIFMIVSLKRKTDYPIAPADVGIILASYILGGTVESAYAAVIPAYGIIVYIICYIIFTNLKNMAEFVSENEDVKSFKADQAWNVNIVMLAFFMIVCLIAMFIVPRLHIQQILAYGWYYIWGGIVWLLRKIDAPTGGYELEFSQNKPAIDDSMDSPGLYLGTEDGSLILNAIAVGVAVVLMVVMAVLIIIAVRKIRFSKVSGNDVREFIKPDFYDIITGKAAKPVKYEIVGNNNEKVRKKYKRYIMKNKGKNTVIPESEVPHNITKLAGGDEAFTKLYEKARYSNEKITDEEYNSII